MEIIRNKVKPFLDKYLILFLALFGLLTVLPYVSFFKELQITHTLGLIYRGILLGIIGLSFIFTIIIYKFKLSVTIYIFVSIYLISQIITIFVSPIIKNTEIPILYTIMGLGQSVITSLSVLVYLTINKDAEYNKKIINILCLAMLCIGVLLCLYTYIFQYEAIYHTFNTEYGWNYDVTSVFAMKTEYGFMLFVCSIFSIFYILNGHKYWMYVFPVFFLANMFISRSKTSILCTTIILLCLLIVHFVKSWNKHKMAWIITLSGTGALAISLIVLTALKIGWFEKFHYYITQVIFNDAYVVFEDRFHKWGSLITAINNPFNVLFGHGERITPLILSECGCATIGDNIYLSNYGTGGLIKFILYIALAVYLILTTWKYNQEKHHKVICLIIQLSFLIGGLFEDDSITGVTVSGLFSSLVLHSVRKILYISSTPVQKEQK